MNAPSYRTARALYPHRPELWEPEFLYEPLPPIPEDHPELALFSIEAAAGPSSLLGDPATPPPNREFPKGRLDEPLPARMLNEYVYCPRLFYYEYVDGVFIESEDTERGSAIHKKVDKGHGELPAARRKRSAARRSPAPDEDPITDDTTVGDNATATTSDGTAATDPDGIPLEVRPLPVAATGIVHSRSATLGSERLGVLAKMDLIEVELAREPQDEVIPAARTRRAKAASADNTLDLFATPRASNGEATAPPLIIEVHTPRGPRQVQRVTPVDYKLGSPRAGEEGSEMWDADKMQLGLQILILRDNGYTCDQGIIYYRGTKQRVPLDMTSELEAWIIAKIAEARETAVGTIPPPLVDSPKCVRCSLAPICLPDETRMLATGQFDAEDLSRSASISDSDNGSDIADAPYGRRNGLSRPTKPPRLLMAPRDDARALYLNTQGTRVTLRGEVLIVKEDTRILGEFRTQDVSHVSLFGNIQITTQTVRLLLDAQIPLAYFSMGGWFYGLTRGHGLTNVFTRIQQFESAKDPHRCLALAQRFIHGKIRNHRTQIMRNHIDLPEYVSLKLKRAACDVLDARSLPELLGMEGAAAALYFKHFAGMIKVTTEDDDLPGLEAPNRDTRPNFNFDFTKRSRRPPADPVNALLSLAYSLLAKDCTLAALAVGFDPYIGFYHQPRYGRPALALDLMEEFRPLIAESAVLTALNNRMVTLNHFVRAGDAINLTKHGRKAFFQAYEQRMNSLIVHPVFGYKVSYRRILELQARMLSRYLTGELDTYTPMMTR